MVSPARSIFDGEALADFVDAFVERIEPRVDRTVVKIEDVAAREEREDPMVMLNIVENRLDGLAHECDHAPHNVHCNFLPARFVSRRRRSLRTWRPLSEPSMAPPLRVA